MDLLRASSNFLNIHGAWVLGGLIAAGLIKTKSNQKKQRAEADESDDCPNPLCKHVPYEEYYIGWSARPYDPEEWKGKDKPETHMSSCGCFPCVNCDKLQRQQDMETKTCIHCGYSNRANSKAYDDSLWGAEESDTTTPTPKNPCPRCEGSAGFPKEFYFHPKRLDFIPCRNCIEMGGNCPGCMEVLPGLTRDRDPWEAFDEGCGKCGWSWADATAIRSTTTPWNVHLDHPGAQRWFASEDDAYAYAYTEGHRDSRIGSPYKPLLKKVNRDSFRKVVRQNAEGGGYDALGDSKAHPELHKRDFIECEGCSNSVSFAEVAQGLGWSFDGYCDQCVGEGHDAESFDAEKIGSRVKRKHYLTVADLKKALKNAKDTDRIAAGDLHDENRIYTPMKRIYRDRIENNDYLIIVSDDGMGGLYWDKDTEDLWNAEDDECSVCEGLGWRYVEDDDGESVRAPCYECGGGSSTGSPTGVVAYDADNYDQATHGPYLPIGAVKRFLTRMPPRQEFYVSFVKANNTVRDMECILTNPYNPDNDVAGVMELGGSRAAFKRFRTDRVISIYR